MTIPNFDEWQEVVNGPETYIAIASELLDHQCCIVGWTDGKMTHHDVLFTLSPKAFGSLQGGLRGEGYLFVSIMRRGSFAFAVRDHNNLHPDYVAEKLEEDRGITSQVLTELIKGVLKQLGSAEKPVSL